MGSRTPSGCGSIMAVVKCGTIAFHIGETRETVVQLKNNFGEDNVFERSWYVKEHDVEGKKVPVVMAASYSKLIDRKKGEWKWTPSDRNRQERRAALKQARVNYGMYKNNLLHPTKHILTKKDRKKEKLNRESGQRNSGHRH